MMQYHILTAGGVDKGDYTKPDLSEPKKLIMHLTDRGVELLNITVANPYYNPHYGRPYNKPIIGGYKSPEHPLCGAERMIRLTAELQRAFPNVVLVGTGYSWLQHLMPYVGAGVLKNRMARTIGVGRMALAYPNFAKDILTKGKLDADKVCIACSACSQIMRDGGKIGCVVRDNKIYGPIYKKGRTKVRTNGDKKAKQ